MKKLVAFFFVVLKMISNISLVISTHYCGGHAVEYNITFGTADIDCGMDMQKLTCTLQSPIKSSITQKKCCENQSHFIQLSSDFSTQEMAPLANFSFLHPVNSHFKLAPISQPKQLIYAYQGSPPNRQQSLQILHQSFLI